ncbi:hypothetical protein OG994_12780 [Micromonospora globbae]|uniref:Uncharacterized protein n=1 Tax=Micromonospora globbae TaxID=1894969 RepID=A0ABZ1SDF5_9ACTN|nr:hypothetical protein [Micromonospora globbae]
MHPEIALSSPLGDPGLLPTQTHFLHADGTPAYISDLPRPRNPHQPLASQPS